MSSPSPNFTRLSAPLTSRWRGVSVSRLGPRPWRFHEAMTTYRVCLHDSPPLSVEADDIDIDIDRAAFYLDDELVAYIPGGSVEYIERVPKKRR